MVARMRAVLRGGALALALLAGLAASARAAATDPFEGAWVAKLDRNRSNFMANLLSQLVITGNTEVWLIEGQDIRAFGSNKVYRVQSVEGTTMVATEDWTRDIDLAPAANQRRPDVVARVTLRLDPAGPSLTIAEAKGGETRTLVARLPAGGASAPGAPVAAQACADVPVAAELRLQLVRTQQELAQCRAGQAGTRPPATPNPAPAPASAGCAPFAGGPTAIRIQGAADAARPVLSVKPNDRSITLTGRSGFQGELATVHGGGRRGTVDNCGIFAVTAFIEPGTQSVTVTATARDGRQGEITVDLKREP